LGGYSFRG